MYKTKYNSQIKTISQYCNKIQWVKIQANQNCNRLINSFL